MSNLFSPHDIKSINDVYPICTTITYTPDPPPYNWLADNWFFALSMSFVGVLFVTVFGIICHATYRQFTGKQKTIITKTNGDSYEITHKF